MTKQMKTWGEALDFTWNTKWKRQRAAKTAAINANRIISAGMTVMKYTRLTLS